MATSVKSAPKVKDCDQCGNQFEYVQNRKRFCSQRCADLKRYAETFVSKKEITGKEEKCRRDGCDRLVHVFPRQIRSKASRYCGSECFAKSNMTNTEQKCTVCGKMFYCSKSQVSLRNRNTCSMACRSVKQSTKKIGGVKKRTGLKHKAQMLCNQLARLRDCGGKDGYADCISCGKPYGYAEMDGGHFIPVTSGAVRYDMRNIHAQCRKCNRYLRGNVRHYYKAMIARYGTEVVDELEALEFTSKKWTVEELEEIIRVTKEQIKEYL